MSTDYYGGYRQEQRYPWTSYILPFVVFLLVLATLYWRFWPQPGAALDPGAVPRAVTARGDLAADEKSTIELFEQTSPSVVFITTLAVQRDPFTLNTESIPKGTGS